MTTFAVSQKDCRTEESDGNTNFSLNDYTRKVDVKFIKVIDDKKGVFDDGNCEKITDGEKERSPYALRETYVEFKNFKAGTYYMLVNIKWNEKAASQKYAVNCYGPSRCVW